MTEFTVKDVAVYRIAIFFERRAPPNIFLGNLRNIQIWTAKRDLNKE